MPFLAPIGFALGVGTAATATTAATGVMAASLVGAAVLGTAGLGLFSAIKGASQGSPDMPQIQEPPTAPSIQETRADAADEAKDLRRKRTRTILTDLGDENLLAPSVTGKALLGA